MSNRRAEVTVYTVTDRRATVIVDVDEQGRVSVEAPAPGTFYLDPITDLPDFKRALEGAGEAALNRLRWS